jgi:RNA polymerase subunit RPABC4/transcription elongation factor Spt4
MAQAELTSTQPALFPYLSTDELVQRWNNAFVIIQHETQKIAQITNYYTNNPNIDPQLVQATINEITWINRFRLNLATLERTRITQELQKRGYLPTPAVQQTGVPEPVRMSSTPHVYAPFAGPTPISPAQPVAPINALPFDVNFEYEDEPDVQSDTEFFHGTCSVCGRKL